MQFACGTPKEFFLNKNKVSNFFVSCNTIYVKTLVSSVTFRRTHCITRFSALRGVLLLLASHTYRLGLYDTPKPRDNKLFRFFVITLTQPKLISLWKETHGTTETERGRVGDEFYDWAVPRCFLSSFIFRVLSAAPSLWRYSNEQSLRIWVMWAQLIMFTEGQTIPARRNFVSSNFFLFAYTEKGARPLRLNMRFSCLFVHNFYSCLEKQRNICTVDNFIFQSSSVKKTKKKKRNT